MEEEKKLPRRNFIQLITSLLLGLAGLLGLGGLVRFFSFRPDPGSPTVYDLGDAADYPPGSKIIRPDIPAVIYNRGGEFSAYSLSCTHLGCLLEEDGNSFSCPCHGSRFDQNGSVLNGPAAENLLPLRIENNDDNTLTLYTKGAGN
jgi:Rieske Fe-S protein